MDDPHHPPGAYMFENPALWQALAIVALIVTVIALILMGVFLMVPVRSEESYEAEKEDEWERTHHN